MVEITKIFEFAAAHHLPYHKGKCLNLHGHSYKLEITVSGAILKKGPMRGMIIDFSLLKEVVKETILNRLDHSNLNKTYDNPTAEIMVKDIATNLTFAFNTAEIVKVRLWETSASCATWRRE